VRFAATLSPGVVGTGTGTTGTTGTGTGTGTGPGTGTGTGGSAVVRPLGRYFRVSE
jgi:hypothetical protein